LEQDGRLSTLTPRRFLACAGQETALNILIYAIPILIALLLIWGVLIYNRFIRRQQLVREGWSGIDVQLKRRTELIPNLVETVKGYKLYEQGVLERVVELRGESMAAHSVAEQGMVEGELSKELGKLFALAEGYPELKASKVYLELQEQLSDVENNIQMARRYYNGTVRDLNIQVESFPSNLVAGMFGFVRDEYFQLDDRSEAANVAVELKE